MLKHASKTTFSEWPWEQLVIARMNLLSCRDEQQKVGLVHFFRTAVNKSCGRDQRHSLQCVTIRDEHFFQAHILFDRPADVCPMKFRGDIVATWLDLGSAIWSFSIGDFDGERKNEQLRALAASGDVIFAKRSTRLPRSSPQLHRKTCFPPEMQSYGSAFKERLGRFYSEKDILWCIKKDLSL